jgi:hypothetical protein
MHVIKNLTLNRLLYGLTGLLSLIAAVIGVLNPGIYDPVIVLTRIMPGVFTQDLLVIVGALAMIVLTVSMRPDSYRATIVILGILGFLFYAYGIYAIEQIYTALYPLYLAILALTFYTMALSLASLDRPAIKALKLPSAVRYASSGYGVLIAIMFNIIWISQLIPLLRTYDRIENTFSVFIIDLVFIMPSFVITAYLTIRERALGIVGLPALFIVGVGILSPLALAEILKPSRYGQPLNPDEFWLWAVLSLVFLIFTLVYLTTLKRSDPTRAT